MSLGKRPRPPMRRTTSLTEFAPDLIVSDPDPNPAEGYLHRHPHPNERKREAVEVAAALPHPPPPPEKRQVALDLKAIEVAEFLRACGICKRRLGPGKDTFIYRGEVAFCSLECREKQIKLDERKEKCSRASMKSKPPPPKAGTEGTGSSETVAAA